MRQLLAPMTEEEAKRRARDSVQEDVAPWLGSSTRERGIALASLLRLASASLEGAPNADRIRAWQDPRSQEANTLWLALVQRYRHK